MFISVITVCYNSEKTIRRTIESVLKQTAGDFEYIIIDGASTDRTLFIAYEYRDRFQKRGIDFRIYSGIDRGIYDAMDKGIVMARGEIIGMVNSDDWYEPDAVETVQKIYKCDPFQICMCSLNLWHGSRKRIKVPRIRKYKTSRNFCHPSMFVTKDTYKKIGVYSRTRYRVYADFDFWLRAQRQNVKITISDIVVSNYTMGGASSKKTFSAVTARVLERCRVYRRNGCSRLYYIESVLIEAAKMIFA